jgi:cellulose synthase/poly-beta-1,6-N-acetylglucosamine synthase-like glycosyltransferase
MIFMLLSALIFGCYAILIIAITIGWWRLKVFKTLGSLSDVKVSVIVAVRNEVKSIGNLLNSLLSQDYTQQLYEIIIVDDNSDDHTLRIVEEFVETQKISDRVHLIKLPANAGSGKKAALAYGIQQSGGELIVITDADCFAGKQWISTVASYYDKFRPTMILGPVRMTYDSNSLFGKFQSLEFLSLISSAAGSCNAGFPLLANGANIAFTRDAYDSCGGFTGSLQYPSGDDIFMMINIKNQFGAKTIRFLKSEEAIVYTPATVKWTSFIQQRMRWVSKSRGYKDPSLIAVSILVFLTNVWLVTTAFVALFSPGILSLFLSLFLIKFLIDLPLMISYSRFQRGISLLWLSPVLELLNAVYTFFIGIAGNIWKYEWKGRRF